jgi:hypothetical protein
MMPGPSGLDVCRELWKIGPRYDHASPGDVA